MTERAIADRYGVALDGPCPIPLKASRADLPFLCRGLGLTDGAEVGVWKGSFSEAFCKAIPGLRWRAVDPWAPYADYRESKNDAGKIAAAEAEAKQRLKPYGGCQLLKMTSAQAAALVPDRSLDVVYIDGNHEAAFVLDDLYTWTRKVRPGGLLAGHDYRVLPHKPFIQVKAAVDHFVADLGIAPWFIFAGERTPSFLWVVH